MILIICWRRNRPGKRETNSTECGGATNDCWRSFLFRLARKLRNNTDLEGPVAWIRLLLLAFSGRGCACAAFFFWAVECGRLCAAVVAMSNLPNTRVRERKGRDAERSVGHLRPFYMVWVSDQLSGGKHTCLFVPSFFPHHNSDGCHPFLYVLSFKVGYPCHSSCAFSSFSPFLA